MQSNNTKEESLEAVGKRLDPQGDIRRIVNIKIAEIELKNQIADKTPDDCDVAELKSLADSIKKYGVIEPLFVRKSDVGEKSGCRYKLVCGDRRIRAAAAAGLEEVPCILLDGDRFSDAVTEIIGNMQRKDHGMFDLAEQIAELQNEYSLTQEQIAAYLCVSQSCVANKLRLLRFSEKERRLILSYGLSERHARTLLKIKNADDRLFAVGKVGEEGLSVRDTEIFVKNFLCDNGDDDKNEMKMKRRVIIKDMGVFFNTVDRALDTVRKSGATASIEKRYESGDEYQVFIRIKKDGLPISP